jgi:hypothetical protein
LPLEIFSRRSIHSIYWALIRLRISKQRLSPALNFRDFTRSYRPPKPGTTPGGLTTMLSRASCLTASRSSHRLPRTASDPEFAPEHALLRPDDSRGLVTREKYVPPAQNPQSPGVGRENRQVCSGLASSGYPQTIFTEAQPCPRRPWARSVYVREALRVPITCAADLQAPPITRISRAVGAPVELPFPSWLGTAG